MPERSTDAVINGVRTHDEVRELVRAALAARHKETSGRYYAYCYVADLTDADVVYSCEGSDALWQCPYSIAPDGAVTLGASVEVVRTYAPATAADVVESAAERLDARVIEAKGTDADGGRVYRVRILKYGVSKNRRRYTEAVMRTAAPLYEGAKAFDHHRTLAELQSSTITGLVGHYRNVEAETDGLYADLHLLPSATHAAESLDAAIAAQAAGLEPTVGISHDVTCSFTTVVEGGERLQEAVKIVSVESADIVAKPSAGGLPVRAVAGGEPIIEEEPDVPATAAEILAALREASDDEVAAAGFSRVQPTTESVPAPAPQRVTENAPERAVEAAQAKTSFMAGLMIREKVKAANLPETVVESVTAQLPDLVRESDVDAAIASLKSAWSVLERGSLAPSLTVEVTKEAHDKKVEALDGLMEGNGRGYRSIKAAFIDLTGRQPRTIDEDFNRTIMREAVGFYSSVERVSESLTASSFAQLLGDSVTRRLIAEYNQPSLQTWRKIVSATPSIPDFRTQRIGRLGGYGVLPDVAEGGAYQPLTSPDDEEATYAISKRGGTEDLTMEMIANDDIRALANIPKRLGLAAAQTLYRYVWDMLVTNAAVTYDSVALFHATHGNLDNPAVLGQSTLSTGRRKMRQQASYGDSSNVLSIVPKYLIVPSALEEIAYQLCTSAVAIPSTAAGPSNTPNLHQGLEPIVVDYWSAATDWFLGADPALCPTIEVGFYQGRQEPEVFTQSDPSVGSMFNADTLTYKIRHIYAGTPVEHRGLYKGDN